MDAVSILTPLADRKRERDDASIQELSDAIRMPPPPLKGPRREFKDRNERFSADIEAEDVRHDASLNVSPERPRNTITLQEVVEIFDENSPSKECTLFDVSPLSTSAEPEPDPKPEPDFLVVVPSTNSALDQTFSRGGIEHIVLIYLRDRFRSLCDQSQKEFTKLKDLFAAAEKDGFEPSPELVELERNAQSLNDNWLVEAKKLKDLETHFFASRKEIHTSHSNLKISSANGEFDTVFSKMKAHIETSKVLSDQYHSGLSTLLQCAEAWNASQQEMKRIELKVRSEHSLKKCDLLPKIEPIEKAMKQCNTMMLVAYHSVTEVFGNVGSMYLTFQVPMLRIIEFDGRASVICSPIFKKLETIRAPLVKKLETVQEELERTTVEVEDLEERITAKRKEIDRYAEKVDVFLKQHGSFLEQRSKLELRIQDHEIKMKGRSSEEAQELQMDHELLSLEISTRFMSYSRANARLTNLKDELHRLDESFQSKRMEAQLLRKKTADWKAKMDGNGLLWRKAEKDIQSAVAEVTRVNKLFFS
jgi:hypothetical protein